MNGFDFTGYMRRLCADIASRVDALRHIDMDRVAVGFSQTRKSVRHGIWATLTPLRFAGGSITTVRRSRTYTLQRLFARDGREYLYLLNFYVPRFLELPLEEKLSTVTHELWHIGPRFDGDLRRHEGRCFAHGASKRDYDAHSLSLSQSWLAANPPGELYESLRHSFADLRRLHGAIHGTRYSQPKLIPLVNGSVA